jgi:ABC-type lipoprotein export system ATPase subunit
MSENDYSIVVDNVSKEFQTNSGMLQILKQVSFRVRKGEKVAIIGPSGSGKSTLLSLIAGLDTPTSGEVFVQNKNIAKLSERERSLFLNTDVSIIFQSFELIMPFTVRENVQTPLDIRSATIEEKKVIDVIESVGLTHRAETLPYTLSGGEKQRVSIARALASDAEVILADEPTGSLDRHTGDTVLELLLDQVKTHKKTLLIITHDSSIAEKMDRVFVINDGQLTEK